MAMHSTVHGALAHRVPGLQRPPWSSTLTSSLHVFDGESEVQIRGRIS